MSRLESANFKNFLHLGEIQFDRWSLQQPPEPDIIAWRGDHQFGIEITNVHRRQQKRKESEQDGILEAAFELYRRSGGSNVSLHVTWAHHFVPQKKDRQRIAKSLAALALQNIPVPGIWRTLAWRDFDETLRSAVDEISMHRMPDGSRGLWNAAGGAFVPQAEVSALQSEIDRKREKPKYYGKKYSEIWLSIVSAFGAPSAWMELNEEVRNARFASPFDRIFLLSSFPLEVVELHSENNAGH